MKTALFTVMLLAAHVCFSQRFFTPTNGSWNNQNLSVESYQSRIVTGFTETNPGTGLLTPAFRITDPLGNPGASFYVDYPGDAVYLMDFTINTVNQTIVLTGMTAVVTATTPHKMFVTEVDFTGAVIQSSLEYLSLSAHSMVPHQVIHSATSNQVVIVGTEINGVPNSTNGNTLPKDGFVLGLNANNFNAILYTQSMTTPVSGTTDNDMLENITEVPGTGYFISGSANNTANEQNLLTMGINYAGTVTHSNIHDLTNFQMAGSSVMFVPGLNRVYVLCNNSVQHTFQIAYFNPVTGAIASNWWRHVITTLPVGSGVDVNGFRLQYTQNNQILVAGYIYSSSTALPSLLTLFQMLFNPNVAALVAGKYYQSANNAPLSGYFSEIGNSVYINTPDMFAYNQSSGKTYLVNQNTTNLGYDLNISSINTYSGCEKAIKANPASTPTVLLGPATYNPLPMYPAVWMPVGTPRSLNYTILCAASSIQANPTATLSPNPANEYVTIENETGINNVILYDLKGNTVKDLPEMEIIRSGVRLYIGKLSSGIYIVEITDSEGNQIRERLVKE